jgi:hypothetical protein
LVPVITTFPFSRLKPVIPADCVGISTGDITVTLTLNAAGVL